MIKRLCFIITLYLVPLSCSLSEPSHYEVALEAIVKIKQGKGTNCVKSVTPANKTIVVPLDGCNCKDNIISRAKRDTSGHYDYIYLKINTII